MQIEKSNLNYNEAIEKFQSISPQHKNIKRINNVFLSCYFDNANVQAEFQNLIDDKTTDFSRYTFFYSNYLLKKLSKKAKFILNEKLSNNPRNYLINFIWYQIKKAKLFTKHFWL